MSHPEIHFSRLSSMVIMGRCPTACGTWVLPSKTTTNKADITCESCGRVMKEGTA